MAEKPRDTSRVKARPAKRPAKSPAAGKPRAKPAAERMVRKQVLLTSGQSRRLRQRAAETGEAEAEIVRRGVDLVLDAGQADDADWKAAWRKAAGMWKDHDDLDAREAERRASRARRRLLQARLDAD